MSSKERSSSSGGSERSSSSSGSGGGTSNSLVYVGRLSSRTRERDLEDVFLKYGRIERLDLKAGFAFIKFADIRDAEDAIRNVDGTEVDGSRVIVEPSHRGEGRKCFSCGKEGHRARDCRDGPRAQQKPKGCFVCGELGHFAKDCRNPSSRSRSSRYSNRFHPYHNRQRSRSRDRSPRRRSRSRDRSPPPPRSRSRDRSPSPRRSRSRDRSPPPKKASPTAFPKDRDVSPANHNDKSPIRSRERSKDRDREKDRSPHDD